MALEVTTRLDPEDIGNHLRRNPDEAFEALAHIADQFDSASDGRKWAENVAAAHSGAEYHQMVLPLLLLLVEAIGKAEAS